MITQRAQDWMLAWDLALHYPLWGWKTYDNQDFIGIGFVREEPRPDFAFFGFVSFVPILDIKMGSDGKPTIKPYDWKTIRIFGLLSEFLPSCAERRLRMSNQQSMLLGNLQRFEEKQDRRSAV
jgi:hypothetical protein